MPDSRFDVIIVGTGFASSFFLHRFLARSGPATRVLVLERGQIVPHKEQGGPEGLALVRDAGRAIATRGAEKGWMFRLTFGGGSNCWYACTPRMLPDDFRTKTRFNVGDDWPVTYDELESYYCDAEDMLQVAGSSDDTPFPRSRPYPQPPHRMNAVDRMFKKQFPDELFIQPTARPTRATANRPPCCGNAVCHQCPIDSKFSVMNELMSLYSDPRVELRLGSTVQVVETRGGVASGVRYLDTAGAEQLVEGDLVVLGANAIFNPHILLRSGLRSPATGRGIGEQVGLEVILHLDGVDNYGASTWVVGHWYGLHGPERRHERAAALIELSNSPRLRDERGKWRQIAHLRVIFEELRRPDHTVTVDPQDSARPAVTFTGISSYTQRAMDQLPADLERRLAGLPIESMFVAPEPYHTEAHILGSAPMGNDPATSVVDRYGMHHTVRNLLVLGGSMFPTMAPANPTLTISALALRAADHVSGSPKSLLAGNR